MGHARSWAIAFAVLACCAPSAFAEEKPEAKPIKIPLKEIWALGMPGTRNVRDLSAARADERLVESIRKALKPELDHKEARRGFAVLGIGDDALRQAHGVLANGEKVRVRFPVGEELSAVFFSYQSPFFVHLNEVKRQGNAMRISYRFVPHASKETTDHFALIPLGKLPAGRYSVRVEQDPMEKKYTDQGFPSLPKSAGLQLVSRTFHFIVAE